MDFVTIISNSFYIILLIICVFVILYATLQLKNNQFISENAVNKNNKGNTKSKTIKILIIAIVLFVAIYFKSINGFSTYKASQIEKDNYAVTMAEIKDALSLEFKAYGKDTYSNANDMALSLNYRLPIKQMYYTSTRYEDPETFSNYEILNYRLHDFKGNPTLVNYEGVMMSIIKFQNSCNYVNKQFIGKSDCIIEVDLNHYEAPNQIGQDRVLFAIDGKNNTIVTGKGI